MNHRIAMLTTLHPHDDIRIYHKESKALAQAGWRGEKYKPREGAGGGIWYPFPAADSSLDPDDPAAAGTVNRLSRPL